MSLDKGSYSVSPARASVPDSCAPRQLSMTPVMPGYLYYFYTEGGRDYYLDTGLESNSTVVRIYFLRYNERYLD